MSHEFYELGAKLVADILLLADSVYMTVRNWSTSGLSENKFGM